MNIIVQLVRKGWVAVSRDNVTVHVRGQAHLGDVFLSAHDLATKFLDVRLAGKVGDLDNLVSSLNGTWAVVVDCGGEVYLAVDHLRSVQILYSIQGSDLFVFDDVQEFKKGHRLLLDEDCVHEYLSSGYVYRNRTLYKNVYSLQAAERVMVTGSSAAEILPRTKRYWRYVPNLNKPVQKGDDLVHAIDQAFTASIRRLVESVGNRRIIVPLSGGHDSRIIVNYLFKAGVKNVLCYTYGAKGNGESLCSKMVADRLGYDWHFVEYTKENRKAVPGDLVQEACYRYMTNGVNRYCRQEFTALCQLKKQGIINPTTDVIVPGYYFDVLAGSKIKLSTCAFTAVSNSLEDENNFFLNGAYGRTVAAVGKAFSEHPDISPKAFFETFLWQERLAKFIVNNVRSFEFLGFDWRLPVCDRVLFDLWLSLPYDLRYGRKYFHEIFSQLAVPEIRDCPVHGGMRLSVLRKFKHAIGNRTPYAVKFFLKRTLGRRIRIVGSESEEYCQCISVTCPSTMRRLTDVGEVTPNAVLTLRGLALEIGDRP